MVTAHLDFRSTDKTQNVCTGKYKEHSYHENSITYVVYQKKRLKI